jgi:hypothetical protein
MEELEVGVVVAIQQDHQGLLQLQRQEDALEHMWQGVVVQQDQIIQQ